MNIYSLYITTNSVNNKIYYGVHKETKWPIIDDYLGSGTVIKQAIKKHGKCNFKRKILCISDDPKYVLALESKLVTDKFIIEGDNYNIRRGGGGRPKAHSKESISNMSKSQSGRRMSTKTRNKISKALKGRKLTQEMLDQRREKMKWRVLSPEARAEVEAASERKRELMKRLGSDFFLSNRAK